MTITASARLAILDWLKERGYVRDADVLRLLREDRGIGNTADAFFSRVEQDFGEDACRDFRSAARPGDDGRVGARQVLFAVPDDWFAHAVELACAAHDEAHYSHHVFDLLDNMPPAPGSDEMVNRILTANRCPWELVDGRIQPLGDPATAVSVAEHPTGWPDVDREARALVDALRTAGTPEDFNAVGARALRLLVTVGHAIDVDSLLAEEEQAPGRDDVKARLGIYFERGAIGKQFANLRGPIRDDLVKRAYAQSEAAKHAREADKTTAHLAVSLVLSVVDLVRIVANA